MDYTIHELPKNERPREKLAENGAESLSDAELLAILLRTGIKGKNVKELSFEILEKFSLHDLTNAEMTEFKEIEGISDVKAGQLEAIGELGLRLQREKRDEINNLSDVKARVEDLKFKSSEVLRIFYLNSGNEILEEYEVDGSISSVNFEDNLVFRRGLKNDASALILCHNHPSGESKPTEEDISTTEELVGLGGRLGLEVLDHVIVGESVSSMRESTEIW